MTRKFLFLQGVASPFFSRLADWLIAEGFEVFRINFCAGDALYWRGKPAWNFRMPVRRLPAFLQDRCRRNGVTDFVLFGDQRPVHRAAIAVAQGEGMRVHVFEEGYVRPNWITLERGGIAAVSSLPRDPAWFLEANAALREPADGISLPPSIGTRALHDMAYHAANVLNPVSHPGYRTHRPVLSAVEYAGWAWRYSHFPWWQRRDGARIRGLVESRKPYFLFPLQLNADAQVAHRSSFSDMREAIELVVQSFAAHAPKDAKLLIKNHPLDTGLMNYAASIRRLEREPGMAGRILYIETGHLATILEHALGVVTVNSTVGMTALSRLRPTKALGTAIFDLPGLASQCTLDEFWSRLTPPDPDLYRAFRNVVIFSTQINGDFYTGRGIAKAVSECARLLEPQSRLEQLLEKISAGQACERRTPS